MRTIRKQRYGHMSVGIIGAGVFGLTAALEVRKLGADVTIYEKRGKILAGASGRNLFRLHRGYHYPRDVPTAAQARDGYLTFLNTFGDALARTFPHYYAIAASDSRVDPSAFESHCRHLGLRARPVWPAFLAPGSVQACYEVDEHYFDVHLLQETLLERISDAQINLSLNSSLHPKEVARLHDFVVVAAYDSTSEILAELDCETSPLQYELCEVAHVICKDLPRCSMVVMDGPFMSIAPTGVDRFLLYDVLHSVHEREVGERCPDFSRFRAELAGPPVVVAANTRFDSMLAAAHQYLPVLGSATHVASSYSRRVVLPDVDETDARPTLIGWVGPQILAIFSGKVSVAVDTARAVAQAIESQSSSVSTGKGVSRMIAHCTPNSASRREEGHS